MGHIANKIDATDRKLSDVFTNNRYKIDSFQREYRWQRKHIEAMISDLVLSFEKSFRKGHTIEDCAHYDCYYMGPIVLCQDKAELSIVDGQQRLTSFILLFIFLNHVKNRIESTDEVIMRDLLSFLYVTKGGKRTLVLNVEARKKVIERLIQDPESVINETEIEDLDTDLSENEDKSSLTKDESIPNIIARYEDITKSFPEDYLSAEILPLFIEWLMEKVVLVEIKAFNLENAYTIFETMNDRGLTLTPTEILKAYLLSKIEDEKKSDEMNEFWRNRIFEIKTQIGIDSDLEFFRAWLRAKYAETKRATKPGAENEDFELIGTNFHTWVKNNLGNKVLKKPNDYYLFIRSDFDFFSNLFKLINRYKNSFNEGFETNYISSFYTIAESLSFPLYFATISKIDEEQIIEDKIKLVCEFIDVFVNIRMILGRPVTQSSIRNSFYDLIKGIRNTNINQLKEKLSQELAKSETKPASPFTILHRMDNWGYYHYFLARIWYYLKEDKSGDFSELLRSRRQSSLVLIRMFTEEDIPENMSEITWEKHINSVAGHCLIRRNELEQINSMQPNDRICHLLAKDYLPEMLGFNLQDDDIAEFIMQRDQRLRECINQIWTFPD
ncbi:MAG: DUF262 domain-containing protein [Bacteroidales bacterium]|jgi:uncharacterized protein with ParB-like and HNH nuclease domain